MMLTRAQAAVLVVLAAAQAASAPSLTTELGPCPTTVGVQYTDKVLSSSTGTSAGDCCDLCKTTAQCSAFSFDLFSSDNQCSLHSSGAASQPSTQHISGTVQPSPSPSPHAPAPTVHPSPSPGPKVVPSPHHVPAPGPPAPPLPVSFQDVPGISYAGVDNSVFGRGFDAVSAQSKWPVVLFTTHAMPERLWAPPQYRGLDIVQVPDQVSIFTLPANQYDAQGSYIFNYAELETFVNSSSHSVVSEFLYQSFSTTFYEYFKYLLDVNNSVADYAAQHITLFKASLWSPATLRGEMAAGGSQNASLFAKEQAKLPLSRSTVDEKASYTAFLGKFGTHYVSSAVFGGSVNVWISAAQSYAQNVTTSDYYHDSETALDLLFYKFGRVSEDSHNATNISNAFKKNATMLLQSLGGDPTAISSNNFTQWAPGVSLAPVPINATYRAIQELISHPIRRQLLDEAVQEYISSRASTTASETARAVHTVNISSQYYATCAAPPGHKLTFDQLAKNAQRASSEHDYKAVQSVGPCTLSQGHQFGGTMIASTTEDSPSACCAMCRRNTACSFFDFDTLEHTCRLLSSKNSDTIALMHVSGSPNPAAPPAPSPAPSKPPVPSPKPSPHPSPTKPPAPSPKPSQPPLLPTLGSPDANLVGRFYSGTTGVVGHPCTDNYTFSNSQTWQTPVESAPVSRYSIPDGFSIVNPSSSCLRARAQLLYDPSDIVAQQLLGTLLFPYLGITDPETEAGITSTSHLFAQQQKSASTFTENFTMGVVMYEVSLSTHALHFDLGSQSILRNAAFNMAAAKLDAASNHTDAFMALVSEWGGHYVSEEDFGGYCQFTAMFPLLAAHGLAKDSVLLMGLKKLDETYFQPLAVPVSMAADVQAAKVSKPADEDFYKKMTTTFKCQGGDPTLRPQSMQASGHFSTAASFEPWLASLGNYADLTNSPWTAIPNTAKLRPIADVLQDRLSSRVLRLAALNALNKAEQMSLNSTQTGPIDISRNIQGASRTFSAPTLAPTTGIGSTIVSTVPGVCTGNGDVGIGCGYDATRLELYGTTVDPKKPVIQLPQCAPYCYADPPPTTDPTCTYCTYQNPASGVQYRVPSNVYVANSPISGGCYEVSSHHDYLDYESAITNNYLTNRGHRSQTKTTSKILHRFYERDDSLSLMYKYLIWHSVQLVDLAASPTYDFLMATLALPSLYDPVAYGAFVEEFGTHVMTKAYMGGAALLSTYFHRCFLQTYASEYVEEATKIKYWFHYQDETKYSNSSINITQWDEWSQTELVLLGGDAWAHGELEAGAQPPPAAGKTGASADDGFPKVSSLNASDVAAWEKSIAGDKLVPLAAELVALYDFMAGWADPSIVANVNRTISEYYTNISMEQANIVQDLVPKDPHIVPKWCKSPSAAKVARSFVPRVESGSPLMGCPALPPNPPATVMDVFSQRLQL